MNHLGPRKTSHCTILREPPNQRRPLNKHEHQKALNTQEVKKKMSKVNSKKPGGSGQINIDKNIIKVQKPT